MEYCGRADLSHGVVPDGLGGRILVRQHQCDIDALIEQHAQAAHADVVIRKDDGAGHARLRAEAMSLAPAGKAGACSTTRSIT